jgi:uncharacterized protein YyaL (SSP411 family)
MAQALLRAAALTGRPEIADEARSALAAFADLAAAAGLQMPVYWDAVLKVHGPYLAVVIAGDPEQEDLRELAVTYKDVHPCHAVFALVPSTGPDRAMATMLPPTAARTALRGHATGYVCDLGSCRLPVHDGAALRTQLLAGWHR